jgi:penicillin-binding protein 2
MKNRLYFFKALFLIGFLVLLGRLLMLQIIEGGKNRALAEGNRIRKVVEPAPRGIIYDREGRALVRNVPVYRLEQENGEEFKVITREEALKIEAQGGEEMARLRVDVGRNYLYGSALAHVLGYLGEANKEEVAAGDYQLGDLVGRMGVEGEYDRDLRGRDGGEIFEVDSEDHKIREIGRIEPVAGQDLHLSIDGELSKVAYQALEGKPGAVVVTEAKTGQVIVLVSSPSFNPDKLEEKILTDPTLPMFNRAIGGAYPPGSTFKIVTASAGIEEGKVDETTTYEDTGQIQIGEYVYKNWYFSQYGRVEGVIDLVRAIKRSTDTFFYKVGEWVGATKLAEWARAFGLGRKSGIDLPGEVAGLVPDPEWKERVLGERWFLGNTYHLAIGQADLLATPLQVNMMTAVIANEGKLCLPRVKGQESGRGEKCQDLQLKEKTLQLLKEGMKEACSTGGTAFPFFDFSPPVGCKSGTAEFGDPQGRTHAWLTAFAPVDDPEIVVTTLVEGGGEGADVAAPIVKEVMEAWFEK